MCVCVVCVCVCVCVCLYYYYTRPDTRGSAAGLVAAEPVHRAWPWTQQRFASLSCNQGAASSEAVLSLPDLASDVLTPV